VERRGAPFSFTNTWLYVIFETMKKRIARIARNRKAQSAIESPLLAAAVIVVFIAFLRPGGTLQRQVQNILNQSVEQLDVMANQTPILP